MIRTTLMVASVLLLGLAWIAADWARRNFVPSPTPIPIPADAFVQHPGYQVMADNAIAAFVAMPASRRRTLVDNLREHQDGALDRLLFTWFPALTRSFPRVEAVVVFREHSRGHSRATPASLE